MHVLALVLGILSIAIVFVPGINLLFAPMLSAGAIITGILSGFVMKPKGSDEGRTMGRSGFALGCVGMGLSIVLYGSCAVFVDEVLKRKAVPDLQRKKELDTEEIKNKLSEIEKKLQEQAKKYSDRIDQLKKEETEEKDKIDDKEKYDRYMKELTEKKQKLIEEMRRWQEWLSRMPPLESKRIDEEVKSKEKEERQGEEKEVKKEREISEKNQKKNIKKQSTGSKSRKQELIDPFDYY